MVITDNSESDTLAVCPGSALIYFLVNTHCAHSVYKVICSDLQRYLPVPYVVEIADGYPPMPCPGKVGVATETTGVANDCADCELFILWFCIKQKAQNICVQKLIDIKKISIRIYRVYTS